MEGTRTKEVVTGDPGNGSKRSAMFGVRLGGTMSMEDTEEPIPKLNEALEQQARHIGQALHDDCGQLLAAARLALADVNQEASPQIRVRLQKVTHLLDEIEDSLRNFSHQLNPAVLDDLGLSAALQMLARGAARRSEISISIRCPKHRRLPGDIEAALYRIAQEALANAMRHGKATHVVIWIRLIAHYVLGVVSDNGIGFHATSVLQKRGRQGLGIRGIRARIEALGGKFSIRSSVGHGTRLVLLIPLRRAVFPATLKTAVGHVLTLGKVRSTQTQNPAGRFRGRVEGPAISGVSKA